MKSLSSNISDYALHSISTGQKYLPEDNIYKTVFVDITHRCNMECNNCYIPNRDIPDMDAQWLYSVIKRLPRRTRIRLVGAEPTVRKDLAEIIATIRKIGHTPVILSNGLKLANRRYVQELKTAGLRTLHLSLNGGLSDDAYEAIDGLRCASRKLDALKTLVEENMFVTVGMILVRGVNESQLKPLYRHLKKLGKVKELHIRSIGPNGRHMSKQKHFSLDELAQLMLLAIGVEKCQVNDFAVGDRCIEFNYDGIAFQLTQWPDLGSEKRGRLTPEGYIEPFFEHIIANEGGY